jgi:large subunit ribosomal protein L29|tara:strand:+ start:163 stop:369 length:207 start_codon:yes stop_codon:yes gene_type:complete
MSFSKIKELESLDQTTIEKTILDLSKELVELRIKKATRQNFKPHNFKHIKRKLSQLLTVQNLKKLNMK